MAVEYGRWIVVGLALAQFAGCGGGGGSGGATPSDAAAMSDASVGGDSTPQDDVSTPPFEASTTPTALDGGGESSTPSDAVTGPGCGWHGAGTPLHVTDGIDVCLPPVVCTSETCPPPLGQCVGGVCQFKPGYEGLRTVPQSWATYYCTLSTGGCHGVTQIEFPEVTAGKIASSMGLSLCEGGAAGADCVGIAASSPMVVGNSQVAKDPSTGSTVGNWGLGPTEASGLCYSIEGPGGRAVVALTDRCGGYCKCGGSGFQECGPCVSAPDMQPNCACVGTVPGLYTECCGLGCSTTQADCDWCASNNHAHFDLDTGTFNHVCGAAATNGSCQLTKVSYVPCLGASSAWPPGGASAGACKTGSFGCTAATPHQVQVPGTGCCCNWDLTPQPDGSCK